MSHLFYVQATVSNYSFILKSEYLSIIKKKEKGKSDAQLKHNDLGGITKIETFASILIFLINQSFSLHLCCAFSCTSPFTLLIGPSVFNSNLRSLSVHSQNYWFQWRNCVIQFPLLDAGHISAISFWDLPSCSLL